MGNFCCSCFNKKEDQLDDENSETRRILEHPVGINDGDHNDTQIIGNHGGGVGYGSIDDARGLGEAADATQLYNRVLNQLSSRVIDISSIYKTGEQADLSQRENAIRSKLSSVHHTVTLKSNRPIQPCCLDHNWNPKAPIPMEDYRLISNIATRTAAAVEHGFRVCNAQEFIVNFQ